MNSNRNLLLRNLKADDIITDGLILHLDAGNNLSYSGSGTFWNDLTSNNNDGTLINGVGYSSSNDGFLIFDGLDDYVTVPPDDFNLTEFTVSLWINSKNVGGLYNRLINKGDTSGATKGFTIAQAESNNKLVFVYQPNYFTGEVRRRSTTVFSNNTWYNIVMTNSNAGIEIYVNGVVDAGEPATGGDVNWSAGVGNNFAIGGRSDGSRNYKGDIAQIAIYNRQITPSEILENFNVLKNRFGL
jgi:hypothetical protein